jgi:hypothetical protein
MLKIISTFDSKSKFLINMFEKSKLNSNLDIKFYI